MNKPKLFSYFPIYFLKERFILSYILVIVESPSKAKTIEKYLGKEYKVIASKGHIYDLPPKELGIDLHNNFKEKLVPIKGKEDTIKQIKKLAKDAEKILLAPDPDREGEAIAFHLKKAVGKDKEVSRVTFNAITKDVVKQSVENPGELNQNMYNSQKTRRVLDRLVGYQISPILWDKIASGLSAGRVQSVALRIIVEREDEIRNFKPEQWFSIKAFLNKENQELNSTYYGESKDKKSIISNKEECDKILLDIKDNKFTLMDASTKEKIQNTTPPFTTSKLQQEASSKLGFSTKQTMQVAQRLYEGKSLKNFGTHGLITYMRTDSVRTDEKKLEELREYISNNYDKEYLAPETIIHKGKSKGDSKVQDAHEAIRPASLQFTPESIKDDLNDEEYKLYSLIWNKFITSQMAPAIIENTTYFFECNGHFFKTSGNVLKFAGFKTIYEEEKKEKQSKKGDEEESPDGELPKIELNEELTQQKEAEAKENWTSPPARYNEAGLVKELEDKGIGRPSTYAAIISNITGKKYVEIFQKRFRPTELGEVLCKMLIKSFPEHFDVKYTAKVEKQLDSIEDGEEKWTDVMSNFWDGLSNKINQAYSDMPSLKPIGLPTGQKCKNCELGKLNFVWKKNISFLECDRCSYSNKAKKIEIGQFEETSLDKNQKPCNKCGGIMDIKEGKYGQFYACTNYPDCKNTMPVTTGVKCTQCHQGEYTKKVSKNTGKAFWGCSSFPKCKGVLWDEPVSQICVHCRHNVLVKKGNKIFCPKCKKYN